MYSLLMSFFRVFPIFAVKIILFSALISCTYNPTFRLPLHLFFKYPILNVEALMKMELSFSGSKCSEFVGIIGISIFLFLGNIFAVDLPLSKIVLPEDFHIAIFAENIYDARSLAQSPLGTVFVGSRTSGNIYALRDENKDGEAELRYLIDSGLDTPNGVTFLHSDLYVALPYSILRYENIEQDLSNPPEPEVVLSDFASLSGHEWRYLRAGPDGKLYIAIGCPGNINDQGDPYSTICRFNSDGSAFEVYAQGIRNSVGFDWHPQNSELWFTENGRDWLGDDQPPDELNKVTAMGAHFGFPYVHGTAILDPDYGIGHNPDDYVAPVKELGPHVAALGMRFYRGLSFPETYHGSIFLAEHGSWNRSSKVGYRISMIQFEGQSISYLPFATGWMENEQYWGRPVDVLEMSDGSLLASDDYADVIYRIWYEQSTEAVWGMFH